MTKHIEQHMQVNLVEALAQYGHMERETMDTANTLRSVPDSQANLVRNTGSNDLDFIAR